MQDQPTKDQPVKVSPKKMILSTGGHLLFTSNVYEAFKLNDEKLKVKYSEKVFVICKTRDLIIQK